MCLGLIYHLIELWYLVTGCCGREKKETQYDACTSPKLMKNYVLWILIPTVTCWDRLFYQTITLQRVLIWKKKKKSKCCRWRVFKPWAYRCIGSISCLSPLSYSVHRWPWAVRTAHLLSTCLIYCGMTISAFSDQWAVGCWTNTFSILSTAVSKSDNIVGPNLKAQLMPSGCHVG